ncbi:Aldo keto reductase protein [Rutstroemia sp. NJR-2017a WRK4]|nr:Aldo keto reductase protein [Rutstroemia sp. NJR-2017a WRK4]
MPPREYPRFANGDVLIVSPTGRQWKLNSWVLLNHSAVLAKTLNDMEPRHITKSMAQEGKCIKWKLEMKPFRELNDARFRSFEAVPIKKKNQFQIPDNFNGTGDIDFETTYDNFFRMLYNLDPIITDDLHLSGKQYITDCISVLQAADYLDSLPAVRAQVEKHLLRMMQTFWVHVAKNPEAWADIAVRLQSDVIFQEAMCHIIGAYELSQAVKKATLARMQFGSIILELAELKARELKDMKIMTERRLMQFFPQRLIRHETDSKIPGRADYSADIYLWQALTMVRQFFGSCMLANRHHRAEDGGMEFYRMVERGDYIDKKAMGDFHACFGMSTKGRQCLLDAVETIKEDLRVVVGGLLREELQLRTGDGRARPRRYLTCMKIRRDELPWVRDPDLIAEMGRGWAGEIIGEREGEDVEVGADVEGARNNEGEGNGNGNDDDGDPMVEDGEQEINSENDKEGDDEEQENGQDDDGDEELRD